MFDICKYTGFGKRQHEFESLPCELFVVCLLISDLFLLRLKSFLLCVCVLVTQSCLTLCNPMDCSPPDSLSMEFSRQECWSGLPFPSPGDLPNPGIEPRSPVLQADSLLSEPSGKPTIIIHDPIRSTHFLYIPKAKTVKLLHVRSGKVL